MSQQRIGLYAGSFDPLTRGHEAVIHAALHILDHLVIGIGTHAGKTPHFSLSQRRAMIEAVARPLEGRVSITEFAGLTVECARSCGAHVLIRGVRSTADFNDEISLAGMNADLAPDLQTLFIPATSQTRHITATLVRQILGLGGDVSRFVPSSILPLLKGS